MPLKVGLISYLSQCRESRAADDGAVPAHVLDGTADTLLVDWLAPGDLQAALLHHARRVVPDAVAELAGHLRISRYLQQRTARFINRRFAFELKLL